MNKGNLSMADKAFIKRALGHDQEDKAKKNAARHAKHQAMLDLGLVRVRGAVSGKIYYE